MAAILSGIGVSAGVAVGPVAVMAPAPALPTEAAPVGDVDAESAAARAALLAVAADLDTRAARGSGPAAEVLAAQALILRDPALDAEFLRHVKAGRPAPHAVHDAFVVFRDRLAAVGGYLGERAADLDDLRNRVVARLLGLPMPGLPDPGHPYVLLASDVAPADTAALDPTRVLAIVTEHGGPTSHTAILAKSLGVPAVVACAGATDLADGVEVLVDGATGTVEIEPDPVAAAAAVAAEASRRSIAARVTGPGATADGRAVTLLVNMGATADIEAAAADGEGVGLFRTEFLFLDRAQAPGFDEQRGTYARVFAAFPGRRVVVRTLDAGADKPLRFATQPDEPNPALGVRGLRTARRLPELLDTQLAAVAAAAQASDAEVWVMAPMVSTPAEAAAFAEQAHGHGLAVAGCMVEVPAAALRAAQLAQACDFLSIGTNDLAQYTFAADRVLGELADLLDPWQPALLDLVRTTARAGAEHGKSVGVCGEAASDPLLALVLVGLGVTSLSMAPNSLPAVRAALAAHTWAECLRIAEAALAAPDNTASRQAVRDLAHG